MFSTGRHLGNVPVLAVPAQQREAGLPPDELLELGVPHQAAGLARVAVLKPADSVEKGGGYNLNIYPPQYCRISGWMAPSSLSRIYSLRS